MRLIWSDPALDDLVRFHAFLRPKNPRAATEVLRTLRRGALKLAEYPRLGDRMDMEGLPEVRRTFIGDYEIRYEVRDDAIVVLRIWHTREER